MNLKKYIFKYYNRNLTFDLPNLDSPNEPVLFLGFFASWIRIFICPCLFKCRYVRTRNTAIKNITFPRPDSPLLTSSRSPAFLEHDVCWICPPLTLCSAPLLPAWSRIHLYGSPFPSILPRNRCHGHAVPSGCIGGRLLSVSPGFGVYANSTTRRKIGHLHVFIKYIWWFILKLLMMFTVPNVSVSV